MSRRGRQDDDDKKDGGLDSAPKKLKTSHGTDAIVAPAVEKSKISAVAQAPILSIDEGVRMKSKKELRQEKKALKKAASSTSAEVVSSKAQPTAPVAPLSREEEKMEKIRLRKERRQQFLAEQEVLQQKEMLEEKKLRKDRKHNRAMNAPGGAKARKEKQKDASKSTKKGEKRSAAKQSSSQPQEQEIYKNVLNKVLNGSEQDEDGTTTLRLGVKYKDVVVGTGPMVQEKNLVTVRYKLSGGWFGAVLDSSNNFTFRLGKGEVIQGWDIGMAGMCQGGTRKLIIPPKAGYGASDIGAGPGATLYFNVTVL
jgi:FKBP-type peptidyl-prolyl cis-trans isomerase